MSNTNPPPAPVVELGLSDGPLAATPSWTDVSRRVQHWDTSRVRDEMTGKFQTGTATIVLLNSDRALEPYYSGGLGLRRRRPVRIRWADGTPCWRGVVDKVELAYGAGGKVGVATLHCIDLLGYLATVQLKSPYAEAVLADSPLLYYRFDESSGSVALDSSGNGTNATYSTAGVSLGQTALTLDDAGHSVQFADAGTGQVAGSYFLPPGAYTLEGWIKATLPTAPLFAFYAYGPSRATTVMVGGGGTPSLQCNTYTPSQAYEFLGSRPLADGTAHHWALVQPNSLDPSTWQLYVDGVLDSGSTFATVATSVQWQPLGVWVVGFGGQGTTSQATLDEWAYYGRALTAAQVAAHYAAGSQALSGQTSGARVAALAAYANVPPALVNSVGGSSVLTDAGDLGKAQVLSVLRQVEVTEAGGLFCARDGTITLRPRTSAQGGRTASTTPQLTLAAPLWAEPGGLTLADPSDQVVNTATVTPRNSGPVTIADPQSAATVGEVSSSLATYAPGEGTYRAQYEVWRRSNPSALWATGVVLKHRAEALALELWDRVTLSFSPPGGGAALAQDALVTGISHSWDVLAQTLTTTLALNPLEAQTFARWDVGTWAGRSDSLWGSALWGAATWGPQSQATDATTARWFF